MLRSIIGIILAFSAPALFFALPNYFHASLQISGLVCLVIIFVSYGLVQRADI